MKTTVTIAGMRELRQKLIELPAAASGDLLLKIVKEAAEPMRSAASSLAPRLTGQLGAGMRLEVLKSGRGFAYVVIAPSADSYYGLFQEFGLGSGRSEPLRAKTLRRRANKALKGRIVRKPNMPAQPFMRPAVEWKGPIFRVIVARRLAELVHRFVTGA